MIRFSKKEIEKASKKLRKNIGTKVPKSIKMTDMNGEIHKLTRKQYYDLFRSRNLFRFNHSRMPNYVTLNGKSKTPVVINYQDDKYSCACASFQMCVQGEYSWIDESIIKKAFNTGINGTSPSDMIAGAKLLGYEVKRIPRNKKAVEEAHSKGEMVIGHIQTRDAKCLNYINDYGHYVAIIRSTKAGNYRVFDPTKGVHSCKPDILDNATNGRDIGYYSVKPL